MLYLGQFNHLRIDRFKTVGAFLVDEENNDVLLPQRFVNNTMNIGDDIRVFLYLDHDERITATTEIPYIELFTFAYLECVDVSPFGAFLDWGLQKHLFCPFKEQKNKMEIGKKYIVYLYKDEYTQRLVASAKYDKYIEKNQILLNLNEEVDLLICNKTTLGYNAIVNDTYMGLIFDSDIHIQIQIGNRLKGYVKQIRPDNKIDLRLDKPGYDKTEDAIQKIMLEFKNNHGFIALTDNSDPDEIKKVLGLSKKTFKQAVGNLYKNQKISLKKNGISLN